MKAIEMLTSWTAGRTIKLHAMSGKDLKNLMNDFQKMEISKNSKNSNK